MSWPNSGGSNGGGSVNNFLTVIDVPTAITLSDANVGAELICGNGATITVPLGLSIGFNCIFKMPSGGSITVTPTGGTTINGLTVPIVLSSTNFTSALVPGLALNTFYLSGV
jgi:hypothetical protein